MRKYLFTIILILTSHKIFSNGGPIDGSAVYQTGNIVLINMPSVQLIREDLNIRIEGDYSIVRVAYTLQNNAYSESKITYGFPIEFLRNEMEYELNWKEEYVPEIEFLLGDERLDIKHQVDYSIFNTSNSAEHPNEARRSWYVVDFTLPENASTLLQVNYKVKNGFEDWATTKSFFPTFGTRQLNYNLNLSMYWGEGIINTMNIIIDPTSVINNGGSFDIDGLKLEKTFGIYSASFENFDLKNANDLSLSYNNKKEKLSTFIKTHLISQNWIKDIKATSQLPGNYHPENMLDFDFSTAWVEGINGGGLNEKIEIQLNDYPLASICLINGYTKNASTFIENNRIKRIKLDLEIVDYKDPLKTNIQSQEIELPDVKYIELDQNNFSNMISIVGDYGEGYQKIRKVTLTILDVYNGSKYQDTCVSEILLLGYR